MFAFAVGVLPRTFAGGGYNASLYLLASG